MKPEVYSCLKMLESLEKNCQMVLNEKGGFRVANELVNQYNDIRRVLRRNFPKEKMKFIPMVFAESLAYGASGVEGIDRRGAKIQELRSVCQMAISFLKSLDGSIEKDFEENRKNLELRGKEIEWKEKFVEKALKGIKDLPELQRSKIVEAIKKSHREIEKHSRKKK